MKKLLMLLAFIACIANPLIAGGGVDVELQLSETPYKTNAKTGKYLSYIIGETADEYLAVRVNYIFFSYQYFIARYDKATMNLLEAKPMMPKDYIKKGGIKPTYS